MHSHLFFQHAHLLVRERFLTPFRCRLKDPGFIWHSELQSERGSFVSRCCKSLPPFDMCSPLSAITLLFLSYQLSVYGDLPTNATERRSSITLTNKTMGTLSLERRRSSMKSSLTGSALGSKFLQIESRIQPDENPTLEAAVSSSLNRESFLKAPRQEDRGEEDRKGPS